MIKSHIYEAKRNGGKDNETLSSGVSIAPDAQTSHKVTEPHPL